MKEEIFKLVEACQMCAIYSLSRQREEEAEERYQPRQPMDLIVTPLFEIKGCHFLVVLDVFMGYPWMRKFGKSLDRSDHRSHQRDLPDVGLPKSHQG